MQFLESINGLVREFIIYRATIELKDVLEILLLTFIVYVILVWMKTTRAWQLLKGLIVIGIFVALVYFLQMETIKWLAKNLLSFATIAIIVVMQPELRHALEELGKKNFFPGGMFTDSAKEKELLSETTVDEIVSACYDMGRVKTGALIVIEQNESLKQVESTGIEVDGVVTRQLLINIFEHNTPLHDGAVLIRGNRVAAATCLLPVSKNLSISKELGTRHRAAVGISEETDSFTIIVSEETGAVSVAYEGKLSRNIEAKILRLRLEQILNKQKDAEEEAKQAKKRSIFKGIGKSKNEKEDNQ